MMARYQMFVTLRGKIEFSAASDEKAAALQKHLADNPSVLACAVTEDGMWAVAETHPPSRMGLYRNELNEGGKTLMRIR